MMLRTLHWHQLSYDRPLPPIGWYKARPWMTWVFVGVQRPHGHIGPVRWRFELRPPAEDEYSHEWLMHLKAVA